MMLRLGAALASAAALLGLSAVEAAAVTPVEKVVELLKRLGEQIQEEGTDEAEAYAKYAEFCRRQSMDKEYAIQKSAGIMNALQAAVTSLGADVAQLDADVVALRGEVDGEEAAAAAAGEARKTAFAAYVEARTPLEEGIEAIKEAIAYLESSRGDVRARGKAASLIKKVEQLKNVMDAKRGSSDQAAPGVPDVLLARLRAARARARGGGARVKIDDGDDAFLQQSPNAYEYKSNDIIHTLQELLQTFKKELTETEETEVEDRHQHEMLEGARANKVKALRASIDQKEQLSAQKGAEKAEKEKFLQQETAEKTSDQAFLDELTTTCEAKATTFQQRSTTRTQELAAVTEAMKTLEGMGDTYSVNQKLVGLVTKKRRFAAAARHSPLAFVQLSAGRGRTRDTSSLLALLEGKARALNSAYLVEVADAVRGAGGDDHFVKVRGIIKDLIAKLEADSMSEATQKSFCDTEMAKAVASRDETQSAVESKKAEIETTQAEVLALEKSIAELSEAIASLHKGLQEMVALRAEEKASNEKTVADAGAGAVAIKQAIVILERFYGSSGALLQQGRYVPPNADRDGKTVKDLAPDAGFSGEYAGKLGESKGILGLLAVIQSDFERTSTTTEAAEAAAVAEFNAQQAAMEQEISTKELTKSSQETEKQNKEDALVTLKDDAKDAEKLHEAALAELDQLKVSCVDASETYAERRQKRQEEIEGLKQALNILEDWNK